MQWLLYAFTGITIWSATAIFDRFILLRHVRSKRFYVVVPTLLQFTVVLILALWFSIPAAGMTTIAAAMISGVTEAVFLYYLFVAVSVGEVSRVVPLSSIFSPILTLLLGWVFLHETVTTHQAIAFVILLFGGFFLAVKITSLRTISVVHSLKPVLTGVVLMAVLTFLLRSAFVTSDFWTGFFYSRLGFFFAGLVLLTFFYEEIKTEWFRQRSTVRTGIIGNQIIALSGHAFYFLAISLANAALVQSVLGIQSAVIFIFALIISFWKPGIIEESMEPWDILQKVAGIACAVAGSYLLLMY